MKQADQGTSRADWTAIAVVAAITLAGALLRISEFGQSLYGDELWSAAASNSTSPGEVIDFVQSDKEISPPLFATLAWLSAKLGDAHNLIRLPSLIAGIALIPLVWLLALRTVGSRAAYVAAAIAALSPFLAFYSVEARAYSVAMALVTVSTLLMLMATQRGGWRWWAGYGAVSCLAMYAHYTVAFALLAQLAWLLWKRPEARRPALLANVGAAIAYLPWLSSFLGDVNSPSQDIIGFLAPFSFKNFTSFTASAALGSPGAGINDFLGNGLEIALFAGLALGLVGTVMAARRSPESPAARAGDHEPPDSADGGVVNGLLLVGMLALACPVGAGLVSLLAADQFLPRNMASSLPGFAVVLGALLVRGPRFVWIPATTLVVGVFAVSAIRNTEPEWSRPDVGGAAALIEAETDPGVVVVDALAPGGGGDLPVRETLGLEMTEDFQRFPPEQIAPALEIAAGAKLAVVGVPLYVDGIAAGPELAGLTPVTRKIFPGLADTEVLIYDVPARGQG